MSDDEENEEKAVEVQGAESVAVAAEGEETAEWL